MELTFRKGIIEDTEPLIRFLEEVREGMEQKDWFYLDPPEAVRTMMADGTMELWVAEDHDRLAAIFDVLYPGLESFNYGYDLDLREEDLLRVVHMDTSAVHPDYRGQGLQAMMIRRAEEELSGKGHRILLCTAHPENRFSLNNLLGLGYAIKKRVEKYGSERYILRKDIF